MSITGLHLTRIGGGDFLLEPSRSLNIRDQDNIIVSILGHLKHASKLYYDLAEQVIIDPVYFDWLEKLSMALCTINVRMICIHMQPGAAFALASFLEKKPCFDTALDIPD